MNNQNNNAPNADKVKTPLSLVSMIVGIASITICCWVGFVPAIVALITGFLARKKEPAGQKLSLVGMITGGVGIVAGFIVFLVFAIPFIAGFLGNL